MYRSNPTYRQIRLSVILEYHADQFRYKQIQKTTVTKFIIYNFRKNFPWPWKLSISSKQYNPKTEISLITPSVNTVKYIHPKLPLPEKKNQNPESSNRHIEQQQPPRNRNVSRNWYIYARQGPSRRSLCLSPSLSPPKKKPTALRGAEASFARHCARRESGHKTKGCPTLVYIYIHVYIYIFFLSL